MGSIRNTFSWSFSRSKLHSECPRKYYYHYYGFWGGWSLQAGQSAQMLYRLRNMKNLYMWAGEIAHKVIQNILENRKRGIDTTLDEANQYALRLIKTGWQESLNKEWVRRPKQALNLFEHYYNREVSQEIIDKKLRRKVYGSITNFFNSVLFDKLKKVPAENYLILESLDNFTLYDTKVYVVPDFAVRDGSCYLYDWKTGLPTNDDILQLSAYALYAADKWDLPLDKVKVIPVYLSKENFSGAPVENLDIDRAKNYIQTSITGMKSRLRDIAGNKAHIEDFPKTGNHIKCGACFFQEVCRK